MEKTCFRWGKHGKKPVLDGENMEKNLLLDGENMEKNLF